MESKIFEFIWDQAKKNQDKNLIEFLVDLDSNIKETRKCADENINCVYREIGINKEELITEIKACHDDLQLQLDEIRRWVDDRLHFLEIELREIEERKPR